MARAPSEVVTIEGDEAVATLPEGSRRKMKVSELVRRIRPSVPDSSGAILADGVKCALPYPGGLVLVHQTPPRIHGFRWIDADSKAEYGPKTSYRPVRLALPYVIVLAVFEGVGRGTPFLSQRNECFFVNQPLEAKGLDTPLCFPALLNCSVIDRGDYPISWICTEHLSKKDFLGRPTLDASLRDGLGALLRHLFESGFNRSSEQHEGASGFSASVDAAIDPRIANVEDWERATLEEPLFAIEVPWLPTGRCLGEIAARIGRAGPSRRNSFTTAADLARVIFSTPTQ
jgi:hypothetical protein